MLNLIVLNEKNDLSSDLKLYASSPNQLIRPIKKIAVLRVSRPYLKKSADPKVFFRHSKKINCVLFLSDLGAKRPETFFFIVEEAQKSIKIFSTVVASVFLHCTPTANQKSDMKSSRMLGVFYFRFQLITDNV